MILKDLIKDLNAFQKESVIESHMNLWLCTLVDVYVDKFEMDPQDIEVFKQIKKRIKYDERIKEVREDE